ncbi:MAG: thioredoxin family protein [Siculibacillus sp.]|nr:thioredoxin family protein [Siculibacillus sp.]
MTTFAPTRRAVLAAGLAVPFVASPVRAVQTEDGRFHEPWFVETFLDLAEDVAEATAAGRRYAVVWEQRGCPFCRDMHTVHFADPAITDYVRSNFDVLQLDLHGAREVTDFDGTKLTEKAFAARYGIRLTPTVQFFPESAEGLAGKAPTAREVARMPGLLPPRDFLAIFHYVREKAYERMSFPDFARTQAG